MSSVDSRRNPARCRWGRGGIAIVPRRQPRIDCSSPAAMAMVRETSLISLRISRVDLSRPRETSFEQAREFASIFRKCSVLASGTHLRRRNSLVAAPHADFAHAANGD
ncbi:MAG: hypothetical protein R3C97_18210 [Geminicoccaceae bacterium]